MIESWVILMVSLTYVGVLFGIAWWGDRRAEQGRSLVRNPLVYTLSIAVYCTSWTFYGAVGSAALHGPEFLTIYIGPTLTFLAWWFVLRKIARITRAHRITSIADFIASRYGKSTQLSVLVTVIATAGTMPYIALQLKAVAQSFTVLAGPDAAAALNEQMPQVMADTAFWVALAMAVFGILFGTRHIDASEHHEGVVTAVAFESVVKLLAFLAVGVFVTFGMFDGPGDLFERARASGIPADIFTLGLPDGPGRWVAMVLLSMCAIVCLPRQFQVTFVETVDERHLATASWLFPLYLLVISLFVVPIAVSGLMVLPGDVDADSFVLTVPLSQGQEGLALLAFVGGLSAATGMVIVATIALSTMVSNDLVMPALLRIRWLRLTERGDLTGLLLFIRRAAIVAVLFLGYAYYRATGQSGALAAIGLTSFAAAAQFAPAMIGGLFWKGATRAGAITGLALGFAAWAYTLLLPSLARSGYLDLSVVAFGPGGIDWLRPEALLGLDMLDPLSHSLFWSWLLNIGTFVGVSLFGRQSPMERVQATVFADVFKRSETAGPQVWRRSATVKDLYALVQQFLGRSTAHRTFRDYEREHGVSLPPGREADAELLARTERLLAGSIGGASARVMVASVAKGEMVSLDEVLKILEETSQVIEYSQRLEQKSAELERTTAELREANQRLKELDRLKDEFLSTISHELRTPLTSIRSFSEILVDTPSLEAGKAARFLGIIVRESERLTRLIDQLLDLARLQAGHGDWAMGPVDLDKSLEDAAAVTAGLFADKHARLVLRLPPAPQPVYADRDRLMQVFVNLLSNAVKVVPEDGSGRVMISAIPRGEEWMVTISDNGPGIAAEDRERVFDRFVQVPRPDGAPPGGTGLGLPISRQIVEHFGGRIWIEEAPLGGAMFCLTLPVARTTPASLSEAS
ncbi:ATP-binding protein [Novispirillum sp. DQ9]|uniref:ATP-binding protein n=1 Tax=Novispirillum sp. DQ9 TaxID=3398612 RepID=UPI003C7BCA24